MTQVRHHQATLLSGPLLSSGRLLSYYSLAWLAIVLSIALTVVAGLSTRATVLMAIVLFTVCAVGPILGAAVRLLL